MAREDFTAVQCLNVEKKHLDKAKKKMRKDVRFKEATNITNPTVMEHALKHYLKNG